MTPAPLLVALLSFAPPDGAGEPPAPTVSPSSDANADYQAALERVRTAQTMANEEPARGAVQLRDALQLLRDFGPVLAKDPEGQDLRTMALLTLARALLATDDAEGARDVMDEAIRTARGDPLPAKQFGPGLAALSKERSGVLAKLAPGTIEIDCHVECRVFINERPSQTRAGSLIPGTYRIRVEAADGSETPIQELIDVGEGLVAKLEFGTDDGSGPIVDPPKTRKRMMPRWAEIVLMTAGAAAIGTGAALWAIDDTCAGGGDINTCPNVYITKNAGIATLAAGGAVFLTGTVMLAVDEVRVGRARGTELSLMWTLRF